MSTKDIHTWTISTIDMDIDNYGDIYISRDIDKSGVIYNFGDIDNYGDINKSRDIKNSTNTFELQNTRFDLNSNTYSI